MKIATLLLALLGIAAMLTSTTAGEKQPLIRIGISGCNTSHVPAFTALFNDPKNEGDSRRWDTNWAASVLPPAWKQWAAVHSRSRTWKMSRMPTALGNHSPAVCHSARSPSSGQTSVLRRFGSGLATAHCHLGKDPFPASHTARSPRHLSPRLLLAWPRPVLSPTFSTDLVDDIACRSFEGIDAVHSSGGGHYVLFAFSPLVRRGWDRWICSSSGRRIGTHLPSAVATRISPSSFGGGGG